MLELAETVSGEGFPIRKCSFVEMKSSGGNTAAGPRGCWIQSLQDTVGWEEVKPYRSCAGRPDCGTFGSVQRNASTSCTEEKAWRIVWACLVPV